MQRGGGEEGCNTMSFGSSVLGEIGKGDSGRIVCCWWDNDDAMCKKREM